MSCVDSVTSRHCPALQDVYGDIALVLSRCDGKTLEEIVVELTNVATPAQLQVARTAMFSYAVGAIIECEDPDTCCATELRLKQRRGVKAVAATALDIASLFWCMCGYSRDFPSNVLVNNGAQNSLGKMMSNDAPVPNPSNTNATSSGSQDMTCGQPSRAVSSPFDGSPHPAIGSPFLSNSQSTPPHSPGHLTPDSQDGTRAQSGRAISSPLDMLPTPAIGSPFLSESQSSPTHSAGQSTSLGSELIDLTSSSDSLIFSDNTAASIASSCSPRSDFPTLCCDHGRAIIDLRCTIDVMQFQMTELQKQLSNLTKNDSPPVVTNQSADKISGHSIDILLSPPDSRPSSVDVSDFSVSAFSDILSIATPTKQSRLTAEVPGQSELNAPVRDGDGGSAHRASHATPVEAPDVTVSSADPLQDNFTFVQNELDALRTRMMDFDDRVGEIDVRVDGQDVTLEELSKSTATLEKFT